VNYHYIWDFRFSLKSVEKIHVSLESDKNVGTSQEALCRFMIILRSVLHRMRNVLGKSCRENQNKRLVLNKVFPKIVQFMR